MIRRLAAILLTILALSIVAYHAGKSIRWNDMPYPEGGYTEPGLPERSAP